MASRHWTPFSQALIAAPKQITSSDAAGPGWLDPGEELICFSWDTAENGKAQQSTNYLVERDLGPNSPEMLPPNSCLNSRWALADNKRDDAFSEPLD